MSAGILGILAAALLVGTPIFVALALTVFVLLGWQASVPLPVVPQRMFAGIDNFTLMSIPLFILAAELMRIGGLAERLVDLARVLVGWFPGGMAFAAVLACVFFASVSGSSPATLAAIGTIMIPAMLAAGYDKRFTVGLVTTAGSLGIVIPPSITLIIYGAVTGTSIGRLFAAGILPGILLGGMLAAYCYIHARRTGMAFALPPAWRECWQALRRAAWGLGLPVVLLGGIYSGIFTPTESAAIACVYGLMVGVIVYRQIGLTDLGSILRNAGLLSATLLLITAGASAFSWLLASQGIPARLAAEVLTLSDSRFGLLLLFNLVLLVAGCFLDGASAVIILAPLMEPIARSVGVDPVHFGIVTLINVEIGMLTPPVGLNLFVACHISGLPITSVARAVLPSLGVLLLGLVLITYVPWISMVIPGLIYG
ncbi:MAG: TRAP transporter large permease [Alphaproteobacteria bacterium]|nr:TRAP transporter large permease [Alphaproteobacteria bacterium]